MCEKRADNEKSSGRGTWMVSGILALWLVLAGGGVTRAAAAAEEPGTIGIAFAQLYADEQPSKRGVLVVRRVAPESAAAEAGVRVGELVVSINGAPVAGREARDIAQTDFIGPIGGSVRLTLIKLDGTQADIVLARKPFPPHLNPASDVFAYVVPGTWRLDPRFPFPLPWAPSIQYKGFEDLAFAPGFDEVASDQYHSYLFLWWLDGAKPFTAAQLQADMLAYFRGLAAQRGGRLGFTPDLAKVTAEYHDARPPATQTFGGVAAKAFAGVVTIYDTHGKVITLHSEVTTGACEAAGHTAALFAMSIAPRPAGIWPQLDAVRDGFKCSR